MKFFAILVLGLSSLGCAVGVSGEFPTEPAAEDKTPQVISIPDNTAESFPDNKLVWSSTLRKPCNPDRFLADSIPPGYKIDPDCPPEIIWPPKVILKGDPGPVIKLNQ